MLVDRADIAKLLAEQEVSLSGLVNPQQATKVGQLTGAKLLITGSVLQVDNTVYLIAKIIGTETSRVVGASVKGNVRDDLGKLAAELATEITKTVAQRADDLVAKPISKEDRIAALKKKLGDGKRPSVLVEISEQHTGQVVPLVVRSEVVVVGRAGGQITIDPAVLLAGTVNDLPGPKSAHFARSGKSAESLPVMTVIISTVDVPNSYSPGAMTPTVAGD